MGTKGADVTEVRDTGVDVERGYCYTSDILASRVLFHLFCYHGVGWGGGRGTEGKFPASKVPTLLFRTGWRKGTSVYRGSTLPDDALGALPAFIIPSPDNFTRQGLSIFIFPKIKLGFRGLTGPAHVT